MGNLSRHFRAIKGAVSLKRAEAGDVLSGGHYFRAIKGAVSLKLLRGLPLLVLLNQFPRHQRRGLIEAKHGADADL